MKNIIIATFLAFFLGACGTKTVEESAEMLSEKIGNENTNLVNLTDAQLKNVAIKIGKLEEKNIATVVKLNGKIDVPPQNLVAVSAPLGGYLKSTKLLPGMHINKGEIIATMEDEQYVQLQQDYLLAKSKFHFAELEYTRQKELNQSQASSDKVMQQAQNEMNIQQIMRSALAEKLQLININPAKLVVGNISKRINIYSSITGFVSKINANIGKYVTPADVLFELINPTDIHLNLKVFEKDIAKLSIGQKLLTYSNTNPEKKYPCEIILISKDISAEGVTEVHCHFENYDKTLLPGMYMNAEVEINNHRNNALPETAIVSFEGKEYIFEAKNNNQFEMKEVVVGEKENGFITILNTANFLDKNIVLEGAYTLLMKLKNKEE